MFEVFIGKNKQGRDKKFLVATTKDLEAFISCAIKFFKVRRKHLLLMPGWTVGEDLYLINPKTKGQHKTWVITYFK